MKWVALQNLNFKYKEAQLSFTFYELRTARQSQKLHSVPLARDDIMR